MSVKSVSLHQKTNRLFHPMFVASVICLLVNDFALKVYTPNYITGKLSDFSGLYALTFFCCALGSKGTSKLISVIIAVAFILWKSELSTPFIELWNRLAPYSISRVVDFSDLFALLVIPFARRHSQTSREFRLTPFIKASKTLLIAISIFSFLATAGTTGNVEIYELDCSKAELNEKMQFLYEKRPELKIDPEVEKDYRKHNKDDKLLSELNSDSVSFYITYGRITEGIMHVSLVGASDNWNSTTCKIGLIGYVGKYTTWKYEKDMTSEEKEKVKEYFERQILPELRCDSLPLQ